MWAAITPVCQAQVRPSNNNIANAQPLVGVSGTVYGTNINATAEAGEPAPFPGSPAGSSIWYIWTAPISTTVDFKTRGSTTVNGSPLATALAVYRVPAGRPVNFNNLILVAQNENDPSPGYQSANSRVDFQATLGTLYLIQVDGASASGNSNAQGLVTLTWAPSLVAGTFQFTSSVFQLGAADDEIIIEQNSQLNPSLHNAFGANNGRITITRTGGSVGRCEVQLVVTNSYYTNFTINNTSGTNTFTTNFVNGIPTGFTNITLISSVTDSRIAEDDQGLIFYLDDFSGELIGETNANGQPLFGSSETFPTNLPFGECLNDAGPTTFQTNVVGNVTNVLVTQTSFFCVWSTNETVIPSAIDGEDYLDTDATNIVFDDFQMSQDIYLNLPSGNVAGIFGFPGAPPGPQASEGVFGINGLVLLQLTNAVLDSKEDPDIVPPIISPSLGTAQADVLNLGGIGAGQTLTNFPIGFGLGGATVNFERATFRVNKPLTGTVVTNKIWIVRNPRYYIGSSTFEYTMDTVPGDFGVATINWNFWPTVAGSDYAIPEDNGLPQWDFTRSYAGNNGTLRFPGQGMDGFLSIDVVVTNDGAQEFDSDILCQLYETGDDFKGNTAPPNPTFLGNIPNAIVTINFNNPDPGIQPGGAWDRTFNPDDANNSRPPFNTLPGANAQVQAIAIQPNGQAVIGGDFTTYDSSTANPYVARLDGSGYLDTNFVTGVGPDGPVDSVLVDPSGMVYIGGQFESFNGTNAFHIARLTPGGSLDTSFAFRTGGFNKNSTIWAMALDTNGNLLVAGSFTNYNTTNCNRIVRLLPSGRLDPTFLPSSGTPNTGADSDVHAIALDSNGNIIIGGSFTHVNGTNAPHIARLLPNGVVDSSFNPGFGPDSTVYALAVEPNNFILMGGSFANYNLVPAGSIARLTTAGRLDPGFTPGSGANGTVFSIVLQPNSANEIMVGGQFTSFNGTRRLGITRLFDSGWVDTSFLDTAYNQFAGFINHYYNVAAVNNNDTPAQYNSINIVSAIGYDSSGNVVVGGSFTRVGGGSTRDQIHFQQNLTRLVVAPTPGPEPGGIGNNPGNIGLTQNSYSVGDTANKLFLTLDRQNGSLGPAALTLGTNTFPPGPGSATNQDFGISQAVSEYHDIWDFWGVVPSGSYGWRKSDGYYAFNYQPAPTTLGDNGAAGLGLLIHNNLNATQDLEASLSLLNLNSVGLLTLGGQTIPTGPALGLPAANLDIVNNNIHGGTFGFSATNYTVVNTVGSVQITVVRTNGSSGKVTVNYTLYPGFTNGAGTNVAVVGLNYKNPYAPAVFGTLTFPDGVLSESFTVPIVDQSVLVPTSFFNIVLSNPSATALLDSNTPPLVPSTTVVEIIDGNFQPGHLAFSAPSYSVLKGSPALITVDRLGGALGQLSVNVGTSNGTAFSGTNYVATMTQLLWSNQDVTPKTFLVPTIEDNFVEGAKTVNLSLSNPLVAGSGSPGSVTNQEVLTFPSNAVLTIEDTDSYGVLNFSSANYNVLQNSGTALITVTRTGGTVGTVSVSVATSDGTNATTPLQPAYGGTNYGAVATQLTFGPGESSKSFTISIYLTPKEATAANRLFNLILFNGSPGIAGQFPKTATVTILDNQLVLSPAGSVDQTIQNGVGFNNDVQSLSLQPDGSLLAGGDFTFYNGFPFNFLGRLFPDASFDSAFQGQADSTVYQILSQTPSANQVNGSVMIVGNFKQVDQAPRSGIARLNLNGEIDESFNPGAGADSTVYAIAQQFLPNVQTNLPDLSYYLIGGNFANFNGAPSSGLARLTSAGQLDPTFNMGSGVTGTNAAIHAIALEPNNQILVAGDFTSFNNQAHHHLVRLNVDGTLDTNFAAFDGGATDINGSVRAIQIQPDGNIIIGGLFTSVNGKNYNFVARLKSNGSLDTNFLVGAGCNNPVLALALDSQNRILVGGEFTIASGVTRNGITRLNPDGSVDPTINFGFGANGYVDSIVIEANDEIDIAGGFTTFNNIPENNFVRVYGGANAGTGSLEFSQQSYGVLENGTNAVITIERLGGEGTIGQPTVSAQFYTSDTANGFAGTNYGAVSTNIVFPYGETFKTVVVPIFNTPAVAGDALVGLNLTNGVNVGIGPQANAVLVITNIHAALQFSANSYRQSANAAVGYADIQVVRTGNPNSAVSVTVFTGVYSGTNAAAAAGTNYFPVTNVLQFPTNTMTVDWLVPITNAPNQFEDLAVALQMNNPSNAIVGSPSSATLIIAAVNNSPGEIAFSQANYAISEGGGTAFINIVRTNGSEGPVSAILTTAGGTAVPGVNYDAVTNLVNFAAGITAAKVPITVHQQPIAGPDVTVQMTLSNPQNGAILGSPSNSTLTIQNDLENFSIGAADYFVNENIGTLTVSIFRNGPNNLPATVNYTTFSPANANDANGFAVPGVDYQPTSGTLQFRAGVSLQTIPITIIQGNQVNGLETFQIVLSNPTGGAQLGSPASATVVITSDVTGFALATNSYIVGENGSNVVVTINRLNPNTGPASVHYATSDNTALAGQDYVATSGTLSFVIGQSTTNVTVPILNPNTVEPNKSFNFSLLRPSTNSFLVAPSNAVVVITNVNSGISFGGQLFTVSECSAEAAIPVVLTGVTNGRASVDFTTSDLSGKAGINYTPTNGTLYFTNGQNVQDFFVQVINNHVIGPDHTVQVTLSNPTNAQLLNPSTATLTIQECNGAFIVASGTAFVTGSENPETGVIYPNEKVTILFGLRDVAGGNTTNLVATLLQTNGVTNATASANYGVLVQNGPTKSEPFTFTAAGTNGQNITATLELTDGQRSLGTVAFGFTVGGTTYSFTNSQPLMIFGNGSAENPTPATNTLPPAFGYPTVINVSGVVGSVTAVTATLQKFTHSFPGDVNVVLEGPQGEDSVLMSHTGGRAGVTNINLTFDQSAGKFLPTTATNQIIAGTYLPTTNGSYLMGKLPQVTSRGSVPNAPQTPFPYLPNLGTFVGAVPNGTWALWVDDDNTLDQGAINNGWVLNISIGTQVENDSDLEVTFAPSTTNATLGNPIVYSLTLTNYGPSAATNVVISNTLPAGMTYVTNSCGCGVTINDGVLTVSYPFLTVGEGTAFTITMVPTELGFATNTVTALADEPNPNSNNTVVTSVLVSSPQADLGISISESPDPLLAGGLVTYTVVATNNGPSAANGVTATVALPQGFLVTSINPAANATNSSGLITWNIGSLGTSPANSSATLTIAARAMAGGTQLAIASISSGIFDPTKLNNSASAKTLVEQPTISVSAVNQTYTLTWPAVDSNFVLQGALELPPIGTWVTVTPAPPIIQGQYSFTLPGTNGYRFFRLSTETP
jgi:uncharacterized repeat protein (TIGR01451 family)/uncharacterized delta-60 repeat protein